MPLLLNETLVSLRETTRAVVETAELRKSSPRSFLFAYAKTQRVRRRRYESQEVRLQRETNAEEVQSYKEPKERTPETPVPQTV